VGRELEAGIVDHCGQGQKRREEKRRERASSWVTHKKDKKGDHKRRKRTPTCLTVRKQPKERENGGRD